MSLEEDLAREVTAGRARRDQDIAEACEIACDEGILTLKVARQSYDSLLMDDDPRIRFQGLLMKIGLSLVAESLAQGE